MKHLIEGLPIDSSETFFEYATQEPLLRIKATLPAVDTSSISPWNPVGTTFLRTSAGSTAGEPISGVERALCFAVEAHPSI